MTFSFSRCGLTYSVPSVVKSQLIYPANDKVIAKYRQEEKFVIRETAEDYRTITVEYIEKYQMDLKVIILVVIV